VGEFIGGRQVDGGYERLRGRASPHGSAYLLMSPPLAILWLASSLPLT
jgi:hypothetical protein